jgi:putative transposase
MNFYNPKKHHRNSIRLRGYDYAGGGLYFLTLCAYQKMCIFGSILNDTMHASPYGEILKEEWLLSSQIRPGILLDEWILMPNHFHALVTLPQSFLETTTPRPPRSLGSFVAGFKSATTRRIRAMAGIADLSVWQRNYFERIIRDQNELETVRAYIQNNPRNWSRDQENKIP